MNINEFCQKLESLAENAHDSSISFDDLDKRIAELKLVEQEFKDFPNIISAVEYYLYDAR